MLIKVDYLDENGSVCYFCGQQLEIIKVIEKEYSDTKRVTSKMYQCKCEMGHDIFVQIHQTGDNQFEIELTRHMFIFIDDYIEHGGLESEELILQNAITKPLSAGGKFYYAKNQTKQIRAWFKRQSKKIH